MTEIYKAIVASMMKNKNCLEVLRIDELERKGKNEYTALIDFEHVDGGIYEINFTYNSKTKEGLIG